ncbi:DUF4419 domain-containing protein [Streptomyces sp. 5-8]|uniref:DUF4419 domain-containing protein n=1 Tax=Streptomyces musisoli TaxID=2802280 RepID=A0ABS1NWI9_9ACTN|nr:MULTISPECIES: DUF4419 domain-containing protein [Streptomyces]MBL1104480.1 DUF4419 domain-containing protein [Streptomyces musisoli]MBY8840453.1 DUF4419 domain-containing protein [Streptomyces sp. SP2-10]
MAFEIDLPLAEDTEAAGLASGLTELGNERFLRAVLRDQGRFHHRSTERLVGWPTDVPESSEPTSSLLLRAVHLCFTAHLPLSLSPDLLWYAVVHEVAVHVRLNSGTYAGVFTETPGHRQTIAVRDDLAPLDWARSINLVQQPLRARIGDEVADLFQPAFSTTTPTEATAALVALMDVVSPYYRFRWSSLCGIPRIRLEGTDRDWRLLAGRVRELEGWFEGLRPWFAALHPVLDSISATASGWGVDEEFWRSLYKWESASGGDTVTGWINAFFAHRYTDDGPSPKQSFGPGTTAEEDFPSHVSRVPFRWETPTGTFEMAFLGGVLGTERDGEWIRPALGYAVVELLPATEPHDERLPEPWTMADVQRVTGCPQAEFLTTLGTVTLHGEPLRADCAINLAGLCAVRAEDGDWCLGDLVSDTGDIRCWGNYGPDLGHALRSL